MRYFLLMIAVVALVGRYGWKFAEGINYPFKAEQI